MNFLLHRDADLHWIDFKRVVIAPANLTPARNFVAVKNLAGLEVLHARVDEHVDHLEVLFPLTAFFDHVSAPTQTRTMPR